MTFVICVVAGALLLLLFLVMGKGSTPPIHGPNGEPLPGAVASLERIEIGGVEQWVLLRGHDVSNPVLLFLHGGPGMPTMYLAHAFQRELERDFVVVHWDRRGAGKSFAAGADSAVLTVRRTLEETYELTEHLACRFEKSKVFLVGHSWGTYLGMLAVWERPELYEAFVGMGQMASDTGSVHAAQRAFIAAEARVAGDSATVERMARGEAATESDLFRFGGELRGAKSILPIVATGLRAPEYELVDVLNVGRGAERLQRLMIYDVIDGPLDQGVLRVEVPVFFFLGRFDFNTPSALAADYLERLEAPIRELVWFEESAHFPFWTEAERFHREMVRVRDLVAAGKADTPLRPACDAGARR